MVSKRYCPQKSGWRAVGVRRSQSPTVGRRRALSPLGELARGDQRSGRCVHDFTLAAQTRRPALGGRDVATLAQALYKYAVQFTVVKGGAEAELTRINNYLQGGGLPTLHLVDDAQGRPAPQARAGATSCAREEPRGPEEVRRGAA